MYDMYPWNDRPGPATSDRPADRHDDSQDDRRGARLPAPRDGRHPLTAEADARQAEADARQAEADAKPAEADAKPAEAEAKPAEACRPCRSPWTGATTGATR